MIFLFRSFQSWDAEAITIVRTNRPVATRNVLIPVEPKSVAEVRERNRLDINANALTVSNHYFSNLIIETPAPMDPLSLKNSRIFRLRSPCGPREHRGLCVFLNPPFRIFINTFMFTYGLKNMGENIYI